MTNEPCTKIVIDAANLIHDDRGIEKYDKEGEQIIQMIPQRLVSTVEVCQSKGYEVSALIKYGTYMFGMIEYKSNNQEYAEFDSIIGLKESGVVKIIDAEEDDLFIQRNNFLSAGKIHYGILVPVCSLDCFFQTPVLVLRAL